MSVSLVKGQKISLSKEVNGLSKVTVGLGWDAAKKGLFGAKYDIDCDASAIILDNNNRYKNVVYYGSRSQRIIAYSIMVIILRGMELEMMSRLRLI